MAVDGKIIKLLSLIIISSNLNPKCGLKAHDAAVLRKFRRSDLGAAGKLGWHKGHGSAHRGAPSP